MKFKNCNSCHYFYKSPVVSPCGRCYEGDMYKVIVDPPGVKFDEKLFGTQPICNPSESEQGEYHTEIGKKYDQDKLDWTLIPWEELKEVVEVLELGAKKYSRNNWKKIEPHRYEKALMRHLVSYVTGEKNDEETGKSHMAHIICNALFLMWNDNGKKPLQ